MTNIVRCAEYLKCIEVDFDDWDSEVDCIHWPPHEFIEISDDEDQGDCYGGFCSTIDAGVKCMVYVPESVDSVSDD